MAAEMPAEWFVDDERPEVGEIWEDAEGVLYTVSPAAGLVRAGEFANVHVPCLWAFANGEYIPLHRDSVTKPLERAFDVHGNYMLQRPLRYPNNSNIRRNP